ncbi:MAG TPA: DUF692 domain-containing protein [Minicystis sp.]|nr:DUF692 domain-containing protein [Minicystis sp.]
MTTRASLTAGGLEGVGLGLRFEFLDEVLARLDEGRPLEVPFFEIAPENYMRRGGYVAHALERIAARAPLLTHGLTLGLGGVDPLDGAYLDELADFLARVEAPFHSDHLCFGGAGGAVLHDLLPLPFTREAARHAAARAREVAARLGVPFAVENVTHYVVPGAPEMDEAAFVTEVVREGGAGLLLDVNNAFVNAQNYGFDARDFIARLPLDRVVQIHVAGHERSEEDDVILDTHGADVIDPVLELLAFAVARTGPVPVVLERDHHVPDYDALLAEVARARAAYARGLEAWGRAA